jgi:glucose-6-phosphate 1-dehydrogenase
MKLHIDNWRWAGVPFYLRAGKRLTRSASPRSRCTSRPRRTASSAAPWPDEPNVLAMRIQPDEGITLRFGSKVPGPPRACAR